MKDHLFRAFSLICLTFLATACKVVPSISTPLIQAGTSVESTPIDPPQSSSTPPNITITQISIPLLTPTATIPVPTSTPGDPPSVTFQPQPTAPAAQGQAMQFRYQVQSGSPKYLPNFSRPALGCAIQSVAGQVFDSNGNPVKLLVVNVRGVLNGKTIDTLGLTGNTTNYGPGGYEVDLGTQVYGSSHSLYIWLSDLEGNPISDRSYFDTYADCQKNITLLNFQITLPYKNYLPIVSR
ncbi:MAG TPA: hypothetical protein VMT46_05750 [Anaerolineaceae bacterium]|nr:hypothetical protein [Anaerolineaceae bacterium]